MLRNISKRIIWPIVGVGAAAAVLLFGISVIVDRNNTFDAPIQEVSKVESYTVTIEGLYVDKNVQLHSPQTALGVLEQLDAMGDGIQLETKDYPGLGTAVESIGGKTNGMNNEYWQYEVNGIMPQVGADKLEVKNGDVIEWYFDKSEF